MQGKLVWVEKKVLEKAGKEGRGPQKVGESGPVLPSPEEKLEM